MFAVHGTGSVSATGTGAVAVGTPVFSVTVVGGQFHINGVETLALQLTAGMTHVFDVSDASNAGHVLGFRNDSSSGTWGESEGVTVVGTAGNANAEVRLALPSSGAPATFEYFCTVHASMNAGQVVVPGGSGGGGSGGGGSGGGGSGGGGSGYAFADKAELVTAVTGWTGTVEEKAAAEASYGDISTWDVSAVTDMSELFKNKTTFNDDISGWNTANVTTMRSMFELAENFDQAIGGWNTGNVTDMGKMFRVARVFNQDVSGWDVAAVTDMSEMFVHDAQFNQNIGGWNVSSVTTMASMFRNASAFNQPIGQWGNKTSSVTTMYYMFNQAAAFDQDISAWDVSSVHDFESMFAYASAFDNGGQDMSAWDIGAPANHNQNSMFTFATSFERDLEAWGNKLARNSPFISSQGMNNMFRGATAFLAAYPNGPTGWGNPPSTGGILAEGATANNWLDAT